MGIEAERVLITGGLRGIDPALAGAFVAKGRKSSSVIGGLDFLDSKGRLAYVLCRALDARRVVEVGKSLGVSMIYLAAALRDNAAINGARVR